MEYEGDGALHKGRLCGEKKGDASWLTPSATGRGVPSARLQRLLLLLLLLQQGLQNEPDQLSVQCLIGWIWASCCL